MPRARTLAGQLRPVLGTADGEQGKQAGTRAMIDVLLLAPEHGSARVRQAVEEALEMGCSDVGAIRYLLHVDKSEELPA